VLGIWFGKDHINTNWLQIQNKVKIQFEKWKDRRLSLRHKVLIINTGLPIFRISVFCSFILDPDTCPKFLNSLIRSSYSEISVLIIEQSSAC
jgi:hypothetical protein